MSLFKNKNKGNSSANEQIKLDENIPVQPTPPTDSKVWFDTSEE